MASDSAAPVVAWASSLFRESLDACIVTDADLARPGPKILYVNPAFTTLTGYKPEEVIGRSPRFLQGAETSRATLDKARQALELGIPFHDELLNYHKDGREIVFSWSLSPVSDESGRIVNWISVHREVTARIRAEEERARLAAQLQQQQKLESLGLLARGVAHDFNNLLTGVLGNSDLLLSELSKTSRLRSFVEPMQGAARHAADLCNQLLVFAGAGPSKTESLDLSGIVRDIAVLVESIAARRAQLDYELDPSLPAVDGNRTQIQQVILNLVSNAAEALDRNGEIQITTGTTSAKAGNRVFIEVKDNGCGITEAAKDRIFDPFYSTKREGRGLGLSAVLGIVRQHGGDLEVSSTPGVGSCLRAVFPRGRSGNATNLRSTPAERISGSGRVIVVDDEEIVRNVAEHMLTRLGFDVWCCGNATEAFAAIDFDPTAVRAVIVDLSMPEIDGATALRTIRTEYPALPVVVSSGLSEALSAESLGRDRPDAFLAKPFSEDQLSTALKTAFESIR